MIKFRQITISIMTIILMLTTLLISSCAHVSQKKQKDHQLYTQLADLAIQNQHPNAAKHFYLKALAIQPKSTKTLLALAKLAQDNGDLPQANNYYQQVLVIDPENTLALINLGNIAFYQTNTIPSIEYYARALALSPRHPQALNGLGVILDNMQLPQQAQQCYQQALTQTTDSMILNNLGLSLALTNQFEQAVSTLKFAYWQSNNTIKSQIANNITIVNDMLSVTDNQSLSDTEKSRRLANIKLKLNSHLVNSNLIEQDTIQSLMRYCQ